MVYVFCIRLWVQYKTSNNYLSKLMLNFFFFLGTGFLILSVPLFFTTDESIVRWAYLVGDAFRLGAVIIMGKVFWFITLKQRISYWWVFIPSFLLIGAGWGSEIFGLYPYVRENLVVLVYPFLSSLAQAVLLATFGIGIGITLILQGIKEARRFGKIDAAIKSITLGIGFAVVPGTVVINNLINKGGENFVTSISIIVGFVVALAGLELPAARRALPSRIEQTKTNTETAKPSL